MTLSRLWGWCCDFLCVRGLGEALGNVEVRRRGVNSEWERRKKEFQKGTFLVPGRVKNPRLKGTKIRGFFFPLSLSLSRFVSVTGLRLYRTSSRSLCLLLLLVDIFMLCLWFFKSFFLIHWKSDAIFQWILLGAVNASLRCETENAGDCGRKWSI